MASINLSTIDGGEKKPTSFGEGAILGVAGVLMLVLILWGTLFFYKKFYLEKNIAQTKTNYEESKKQLERVESKKVIDFQKRLDVSRELISQGRNVKSDLIQIEGFMIPGTYLTSYSFDSALNSIVLNCVGDNYNTVAKQILSFKNSSLFSQVIAGKTAVDVQTNKIAFPIELKIK